MASGITILDLLRPQPIVCDIEVLLYQGGSWYMGVCRDYGEYKILWEQGTGRRITAGPDTKWLELPQK